MEKIEKNTTKQKKTTTNGAKSSAKTKTSGKPKGGKRKELSGDELLLKALKKIRETGFNDIWQR